MTNPKDLIGGYLRIGGWRPGASFQCSSEHLQRLRRSIDEGASDSLHWAHDEKCRLVLDDSLFSQIDREKENLSRALDDLLKRSEQHLLQRRERRPADGATSYSVTDIEWFANEILESVFLAKALAAERLNREPLLFGLGITVGRAIAEDEVQRRRRAAAKKAARKRVEARRKLTKRDERIYQERINALGGRYPYTRACEIVAEQCRRQEDDSRHNKRRVQELTKNPNKREKKSPIT